MPGSWQMRSLGCWMDNALILMMIGTTLTIYRLILQ
jgi:hypothetical protein